MNIVIALEYLRPGEQWMLSGSSYDGLEWIDTTPKPTLEELEEAWPHAQIAQENSTAEANRRIAFQLEADPLFFGWQRGENTEDAWLLKITEIRERFPYVEGGV
jgi:hypothetical protein